MSQNERSLPSNIERAQFPNNQHSLHPTIRRLALAHARNKVGSIVRAKVVAMIQDITGGTIQANPIKCGHDLCLVTKLDFHQHMKRQLINFIAAGINAFETNML